MGPKKQNDRNNSYSTAGLFGWKNCWPFHSASRRCLLAQLVRRHAHPRTQGDTLGAGGEIVQAEFLGTDNGVEL